MKNEKTQFISHWMEGTGPVSYTHLDVYKRQLYIHSILTRRPENLLWAFVNR